MRKFFLGSISLAALVAGPAMAADMPVKASVYKAPPPPIAFTWTGFYLGVHGGCGSVNTPSPTNYAVDPSEGPGAAFPQADVFTSARGSGCFGGGQIGFNYQFSNNFVVGIEIDAAKSNIGSSFQWLQPPDGTGDINNWESKLTSFGTVRARVGYAFGQWLPYVTGGWAWGRNRLSSTCPTSCDNLVVFDPNNQNIDPQTTSDRRTHTGWVIGAGLEYALNQNWSMKAEYLHLDLGTQRYNVQVDYDFGTPPGADFGRLRVDTVKLGVNYRFGSGPVIAKY